LVNLSGRGQKWILAEMVEQPQTRYAKGPEGNIDRGTHVLKGVPGEWNLFAPAGQTDPLAGLQIANR
jgi:hypothetical protein